MMLNDIFHIMTTPIHVEFSDREINASAFFYSEATDRDEKMTTDNHNISETWLVVNKHVILPKINGERIIPNKITFNMRWEKNNVIEWFPLTINKLEFHYRIKLHLNQDIDIVILKITDFMLDIVKKTKSNHHSSNKVYCHPVSKRELPKNSEIAVDASDDVIIIGYPKNFYDDANKFPIIRSGIIASQWGSNFNNKPCFIIDAKLFPGSSGSIVLSKPTNLLIKNNQIKTSLQKQFVFLGVFSSGDTLQNTKTDSLDIVKKFGTDIGEVWYGYLIDEIINNGKFLAASTKFESFMD